MQKGKVEAGETTKGEDFLAAATPLTVLTLNTCHNVVEHGLRPGSELHDDKYETRSLGP